MNSLPFSKMHGLGNCFILMDDRKKKVSLCGALEALTKAACDRNFGIGADGLLLVQRSDTAHFKMRIINEDGSEAEMCGNGIRCFARYVVDEGITDRREIEIETLAGTIRTRLLSDGQIEVDMGEPSLKNEDVIGEGEPFTRMKEHGKKFTFVSMGNPHAVAFVDDLDFDWRALGAKVECAASFPNKTNVEFVKIVSSDMAEVKVWERGCGETMACGTGACAVAVAGALEGHFPRAPITVRLPGGPLQIHWNEAGRVMMTGPTVRVCNGIYWF